MQAEVEKKEKKRIEKEKEERKLRAQEKQQEWLTAKLTKVTSKKNNLKIYN